MTDSETPYKPAGKQLICNAGRSVFEQGTPAHQVFFIEEGHVSVTVNEDGENIRLAELGPGDIFGEMSIIEDQLRMASVTAIDDCVITVISRKDLEERLAAVDDQFVRALIDSLSRRLRDTTKGQIRYYRDLATFQDHIGGLMRKANEGIDQSRREDFAREVVPLLEAIESILDKYRS